MDISPIKQRIKAYINEIEQQDIVHILITIHSGKMLRSQLILAIADHIDSSDSVKYDEIYSLCAIIEMIHLASLLHDDVIDEAAKRRGNPSINAMYDNKRSIMLGDILYALAFKKLARFDKAIIQSVSNAVVLLSVGEFNDVKLGGFFNDDKQIYLEMVYQKTSALIESASFCAALLTSKDSDKIAQFGKLLGISFQIVDDLLDVISDEQTLGKPSMSDYSEGKVTLPYLLLYQELYHADKKRLKSLWQQPLNSDDQAWIKQQLDYYHIEQKVLQVIDDYVKEALALLSPQDNRLKEILHKVVNRVF